MKRRPDDPRPAVVAEEISRDTAHAIRVCGMLERVAYELDQLDRDRHELDHVRKSVCTAIQDAWVNVRSQKVADLMDGIPARNRKYARDWSQSRKGKRR